MENNLMEETNYNLLIIDRSDLTADEISVSALSEEGFKTVTLPDHLEALSSMSELRPDLIILGEGLAEDSFKVCRRLHQASITPIAMLGTTPRSRGWVRAMKAGADLYLARPIRQAELAARIKAILRRREWACAGG
jgi:DNA-binding response OmpR family regulator